MLLCGWRGIRAHTTRNATGEHRPGRETTKEPAEMSRNQKMTRHSRFSGIFILTCGAPGGDPAPANPRSLDGFADTRQRGCHPWGIRQTRQRTRVDSNRSVLPCRRLNRRSRPHGGHRRGVRNVRQGDVGSSLRGNGVKNRIAWRGLHDSPPLRRLAPLPGRR